ncbi:MAG: hypothetical protein WBI07_19245, partial [Mobilitalea sp.]
MDSIGRLIAAVIAAILIFLYPLQNIAQMMGESIENVINEYASEFTHNALEEGKINLDQYEKLIDNIDNTGELYDVTIETAHPVSGLEIEQVSNANEMHRLAVSDTELDINHRNTDMNHVITNMNHTSDRDTSIIQTYNENIPIIYSSDTDTPEENVFNLSRTDTLANDASINNTSTKNTLIDKILVDGNSNIEKHNPIFYSKITSLAAHIHTNDCYMGHNHISSCYAIASADASITAVVGNVNFFLSYDDHRQVQEGQWTRSALYRMSCVDCNAYLGYIMELFNDSSGRVPRIEIYRQYYNGTSSNGYYRFVNADEDAYPIIISSLRGLNLTSAAQVATRKQLLVTAGFNDYVMCPTCAKKSGRSSTILTFGQPVMTCGLVQDPNPICNQVVDSITASSSVQKVKKGDSIVTTATATYLDGHTAMVACNSNFNTNITGIQNVTLTYYGLVGNAKTMGTRICTTSVTVQDDTIPSYLTITPSRYTVYNGNEPTYTITVTYENGVSKILTAGYVKTGWSTGSGTKTVIFTYTESSKTVTAKILIEVKGNLINITVSPSAQLVKRYS